MLADELYFHRRRGLSRWERVGHPLDTLSVFACSALALWARPVPVNVTAYAGLALFSCLLVTKDEHVHARSCTAAEHWLHAVLFMLHPAALTVVALIWISGGQRPLVAAQASAVLAFGIYQTLYWNCPWKRPFEALTRDR